MSKSKMPVTFADKVSAKKGSDSGGYPTQISAKDLDSNFKYACLEVEADTKDGKPQPFKIDEFTGEGGGSQRRLVFNPAAPEKSAVFTFSENAFSWLQAPAEGTHVLACKDGAFEWIATEEC
jgi:hypothetical protein